MTSTDNDWKMEHCPALIAIKVISGKWKTRALWLLRYRRMHFGELRRKLRGASAKVLAEHLRELEADGLIQRHIETNAGVSFTCYSYTDHGRSIIPALDALAEWGLAHEKQSPVHNATPAIM